MSSKSERSGARPGRRALLVGGAASLAALAAGAGAGLFAGANTPSRTDVNFVSLATPFKLETNKAMATNSTLAATVIGGTTTIPTNATTIELDVTAGGTNSGTLNIYPYGNTAGGSGQSLSWSAGGSDNQTVQEQVGLKNEVTFALSGAAAKITVTITGYSTQVTDGDVSGLDGTSGQVLTDTGSGAAWANPSISAGNITPTGGSAGQVLTNTGDGAQWETASTPLTWTNLTLQNGCTTGETTGPAQIAVDASGVVHFRGDIECQLDENDLILGIATIPSAFCPLDYEFMPTVLFGEQMGSIVVDPDCEVVAEQSKTDTVGANEMDFISLAGVTYTLPY